MATNNLAKNTKVIYPEFSYKIVGLAFDVQNELGQFAREKQYADLLEKRLKENNIPYKRELRIGDSGNIVDFLVGDGEQIILELKTTRVLGRTHFRQMQNYLQQTHIKLGILINFSDKYLKPKRVLLIDSDDS